MKIVNKKIAFLDNLKSFNKLIQLNQIHGTNKIFYLSNRKFLDI